MKKILVTLLAALFFHAQLAGATTAYNGRWGAPGPVTNTGLATSTQTLTLNGQNIQSIFTADQDADTVTISHLNININAITGTVGATDYTLSVQTVGTDGHASGIVGGNCSLTFGNGLSTGSQWFALTNSCVITRGDKVAFVLQHNLTDTSNFLTITYRSQFPESTVSSVPYTVVFDGTVTYTPSARAPVVGYKNSGATIVGGYPSTNTSVTQSFGATVEAAMIFNIPATQCSTYSVKGIHWVGKSPTTSTSNTYQLSLYSLASGPSGGSTGATTNIQPGNAYTNAFSEASATNTTSYSISYPTSPLATLSGGTWYAAGWSTTTATDMNLQTVQVAAVADWDAWPYRQQVMFGSRTITYATPVATTTGFTTTATQRPIAELVLASCDPAAGGSGSMGGVY